VGLAVSCPRCGGVVRPPDLMHSEWRCEMCGAVPPLHVPGRVAAEIVAGALDRIRRVDGDDVTVPMWCPWPLPPGWTVTGVAWAGDERRPPRATAVALSGPAPLSSGPADVAFVAEDPGVGLGNALAGIAGADPGSALRDAVHNSAPHAKVWAGRHPIPLWAVPAGPGRSVYVGEARAMWLYVIAWPPAAGYLLADDLVLHDLVESLPSELVYGAASHRLQPRLADASDARERDAPERD
jgi:hypothetical protein